MNRQIIKTVYNFSTQAGFVHNRNPRNLEKLTIGYKPNGWHLEKPGRSYWHKLTLDISGKNITASVQHFSGTVPVTASTKEWAIKKHLYSTLDKAAYSNLGRILGRRCLETGITEMYSDLASHKGGKVELFLNEMVNSGISLAEAPRYVHPKPSDPERPETPWEVH